jgi:hypothetical protein
MSDLELHTALKIRSSSLNKAQFKNENCARLKKYYTDLCTTLAVFLPAKLSAK